MDSMGQNIFQKILTVKNIFLHSYYHLHCQLINQPWRTLPGQVTIINEIKILHISFKITNAFEKPNFFVTLINQLMPTIC
ncbi:MAG: hypothetical protein A2381_14345 [Bdellovibrionales bacterium RIFOXYB1_FULL_37_110]|nr:MAG: hypothetical protein A2417_07115 [Bdellovibrionales bacterium RIFOXYC1_FULL_37_79]OFZ57493.1 MAG: hypothetical protein A2328_11135 [Bdellovibrionales bacterium RIFOXYB2_FULL_36_6]OFZ57522.1 MAG: hypothetical protein A2381_14345 [Bdellovibrionales bacterium RIFOXYB1_FULL_37_110]OFZ62993.1 MAG: hypothetical protein A2577_07625 [Bdellovibrionales bacterium RIFOXYD1_FULL_36_51]